MVQIIRDGRQVARSRNLRGIVDYARKHGMDYVNVDEIRSEDEQGAIVTFNFSDGAWSIVTFNDYFVAVDYVARRATRYRWDCASTYRPYADNEAWTTRYTEKLLTK